MLHYWYIFGFRYFWGWPPSTFDIQNSDLYYKLHTYTRYQIIYIFLFYLKPADEILRFQMLVEQWNSIKTPRAARCRHTNDYLLLSHCPQTLKWNLDENWQYQHSILLSLKFRRIVEFSTQVAVCKSQAGSDFTPENKGNPNNNGNVTDLERVVS